MKLVSCGIVGLVACGSGTSGPDAYVKTCVKDGGEVCFQLPTARLTDRDGNPSTLGCGPIVPKPAPAAVTFTGKVTKYGVSTAIPSAQLELFSDVGLQNRVTTTTSAADGTYSLTVPQGTPDLMWTRATADSTFLVTHVYGFHAPLDQGNYTNFNVQIVTSDNVESAALLVKEIWDPAKHVIAGTVLDCNRVVVQHAEISLSSTSGTRTFVDGVSTYYGVPGAVPIVAPPDQRGDTNDNGAFAVFHLPPGQPLYVQAWGFLDDAAVAQGEAGLTMFAEDPINVAANEVTSMNLWLK
jgi:hypothetical protein